MKLCTLRFQSFPHPKCTRLWLLWYLSVIHSFFFQSSLLPRFTEKVWVKTYSVSLTKSFSTVYVMFERPTPGRAFLHPGKRLLVCMLTSSPPTLNRYVVTVIQDDLIQSCSKTPVIHRSESPSTIISFANGCSFSVFTPPNKGYYLPRYVY